MIGECDWGGRCFGDSLNRPSMLARPLLSIFLPLPAVVPVAAQLSVTGSVVDELGEPQAYANVVLVRAADTAFIAGAVTDVDGAFGIEGEGAGGDYRLRVSSIGYDDLYTPTLALVAGEPYRAGALALGAAAVDLATATVTADRALFERRVDVLLATLDQIALRLGNGAAALDRQVEVGQDSLIDWQADDVFYEVRGQAYAALLLLRGLQADFTGLIEARSVGNPWVELDATLEADITDVDP